MLLDATGETTTSCLSGRLADARVQIALCLDELRALLSMICPTQLARLVLDRCRFSLLRINGGRFVGKVFPRGLRVGEQTFDRALQ